MRVRVEIPVWAGGSIPVWLADVLVADMQDHGAWRSSLWISTASDDGQSHITAHHWIDPHDVAESISWGEANGDIDSNRDNTPAAEENGDTWPPGLNEALWERRSLPVDVVELLRARGFHALVSPLGASSYTVEVWKKAGS